LLEEVGFDAQGELAGREQDQLSPFACRGFVYLPRESGPLRAVHLSRRKWPGDKSTRITQPVERKYLIIFYGPGKGVCCPLTPRSRREKESCLFEQVLLGGTTYTPEPFSTNERRLGFSRGGDMYSGLSGFACLVSGFKFRNPGSGFRVPGSRFRFPGFGLRFPGSGFRLPGFGCLVPGFGFLVSGFGLRVPGFEFLVSGSGFLVSGFGFLVSGFGFRGSGF